MEAIDLNGKLLKDVSRSFYLTLRLLPKRVRGVISLGYLLARASDTIADTARLPWEQRAETLNLYSADLMQGHASEALKKMCSNYFLDQKHEGERILMAHLAPILAAISSFSAEEKMALLKVSKTIISGQLWDLTYFQEFRQVSSPSLLEDYTYKVAGCVGEFWSQILALHQYVSPADLPALSLLGVQYGKGLQLTNIIRDIPEDYANKRVYIPSSANSLDAVFTASEPWIEKARLALNAGTQYSSKIRHRRLRAATLLPSQLALKTLSLIDETPIQNRNTKIKISKGPVYIELLKAFK